MLFRKMNVVNGTIVTKMDWCIVSQWKKVWSTLFRDEISLIFSLFLALMTFGKHLENTSDSDNFETVYTSVYTTFDI